MIYKYEKFSRNLLIITPVFLWLLVFFLVPFIIVTAISFSEISDNVPPYIPMLSIAPNFEEINFRLFFANYKLLITDSIYVNTYFESLKIAICSTILTLLIAYPVAYRIARTHESKRGFLLMLVIIPFWTSLLIRVYAWMTLLSTNGVINQWLMELRVISSPLNLINNDYAVIVGIAYCYMPFMVIPLYSALEKIDPSLIEAAMDLGCKPHKAFFRVTMPLSLPGIVTGSLLVFIPAIGEFVIPSLLGGSQVNSIGKILWNEFFLNHDWPTASAITIISTIIITAPFMLAQKIISKRGMA